MLNKFIKLYKKIKYYEIIWIFILIKMFMNKIYFFINIMLS